MKRQSNFELLRILTIASIVMGHCLRQSGLIESATGANHYLACFFGSFLRIGVNVFLLIGCWFMVDATFTWKRPLKLYLQTAFYTVPLTVLMLCLGEAGSVRNVIQGRGSSPSSAVRSGSSPPTSRSCCSRITCSQSFP